MYDGDHLYDFERELSGGTRSRKAALDLLRQRRDPFGARLVCQVSGMPDVTDRQLARHEELYGSDFVDDLASSALYMPTRPEPLAER